MPNPKDHPHLKLRVSRIERRLSRYDWTRMDLFHVMQEEGFRGGFRTIYNLFDGTSDQKPLLNTVAHLAHALDLKIDEIVDFKPTRSAKKAEWAKS